MRQRAGAKKRMANPEPELHLLMETDTEVLRWQRRTMVLVSIVFHALIIIFLGIEPNLFERASELFGVRVVHKPRTETSFLVLPPDVLRNLRKAPRTPNLSDKNRRAQGPALKINPKALHIPYSKGNTPLPELRGGNQSKTPAPPAPAPTPPTQQAAKPPGGGTQTPGPAPKPPEESRDQAKLQLEDAPHTQSASSLNNPNLGLSTPEQAIRQSLQSAAAGRSMGAYSGPGQGPGQFNNLNSNFSTEGPVILSDTKGVDFGPYLARILITVRRNWYAVIPEAARLGQKGRVAIVFEILKDGSVPQLRLVGSSGIDPLDRAALASIRASIPFPPLPPEFTGRHLVLQFNFLYNMGYGQ